MPAFGPALPIIQLFSNDGSPCAGCQLTFYESGTSTLTTTYSDADLSVPNTNPVVLDSSGRAIIYLTEEPDLTVVLTDANDVELWSVPVMVPGEGLIVPSFTATVTLTNAEIKALPTTGITLVDAAGSGTLIAWSSVDLFTSFSAGAYTNINSTYSTIQLVINSLVQSGFLAKDSTTTPALTVLTRFLGAGSRHTRLVPYLEAAGGGGEQYIIPSNADGTSGVDTTSSLLNQPLKISADNNGSGNYTGGNAANELVCVVTYQVITVS